MADRVVLEEAKDMASRGKINSKWVMAMAEVEVEGVGEEGEDRIGGIGNDPPSW